MHAQFATQIARSIPRDLRSFLNGHFKPTTVIQS